MPVKARLIVNPVAGRDAAPDYLQQLNQVLREKIGLMDIVVTIAAGDATDAAADAAREKYDALFVAGGDGTLNEALNGVASVDGALDAITFGIIPLGTGNDFAAALDLPPDVNAAAEAVLTGHTRLVDLGTVVGQHFVNVSAGGFVAEASAAVNPQLKSFAGRLAYLIGGAQVLWDYEPMHARLDLETDQGQVQHDLALQLYAVCNAPTFGGGRLIAPHASIDDGWLDLCTIEAMPVPEFIGLLTSIASGEHLADERVAYFHIRSARLEFSRAIKINTDGEVLETAQCEYRVLPRAARFFSGK